jgi:hypothetical protein
LYYQGQFERGGKKADTTKSSREDEQVQPRIALEKSKYYQGQLGREVSTINDSLGF